MIKFILQHSEYNCGYDENVIFDSSDECPLVGAVVEEWIEEESQEILARYKYFEEARLDENGKPYIYKETIHTPREDFDNWKRIGFDHTQEKIEPEGKSPYWIYTRKVYRDAWVFIAENLEQIEEILDKGYEMGALYTPTNEIKYYLTID